MLVGCVVLGQVLKVFKGHTGFVLAVAIYTDGAKIVSGSGDRTVRVWSMKTVEVPVCLLVQMQSGFCWIESIGIQGLCKLELHRRVA